MNNAPIRYGKPYPYGVPATTTANASSSSVNSSSRLGAFLNNFTSDEDTPPPVPEKDYPRQAYQPSSSAVSLALSDVSATSSASTNNNSKRSAASRMNIFKLGKKAKRSPNEPEQISSPWNVKHEVHVDGSLNGLPFEWQASLAKLGYSQAEIQNIAERKRRNPSLASIPVGPNASTSSSTQQQGSTPYRYQAQHTTQLQTNLQTPQSSFPPRSDSLPNSPSNSQHSHGHGSFRDHPDSPASSENHSMVNRVSAIPSSSIHGTISSPPPMRQGPQRHPPPSLVTSSIPGSSKTQPRRPNVIAVQGSDSEDENSNPLNSVKRAPSQRTIDFERTPQNLTSKSPPRISLTLGGIGESRDSVDWSESLFSALPSATAFDGFRSSIIPGSAISSPNRSSPATTSDTGARSIPKPPLSRSITSGSRDSEGSLGEPENVVFTMATAVKLVRAPSMSFQQSVIASKVAEVKPITPAREAEISKQHSFIDDDSDDDDPDSRNTIRFNDTQAKRVLEAVMNAGAPKRYSMKRVVPETDRDPTERPISTATIQASKIPTTSSSEDDEGHDEADVDDTSALDEWLEANGSEEGVDMFEEEIEDSGATSAILKEVSKGNSDYSDEYDDADRPLKKPPATIAKPVSVENTPSGLDTEELSPDSPFFIAPSISRIKEAAAHTKNGSVSSHHSSRFGTSNGSASGSGGGSGSSIGVLGGTGSTNHSRQQSSSKQITIQTTNTAAVILTDADGSVRSPSGQYDINFDPNPSPALQQAVAPLLSHLQRGDPRWMYSELVQVAEGESGGVYSAKLRHETQSLVAIKKVMINDSGLWRDKILALAHEMSVLASVKHENIMIYTGVWILEDKESPVTENSLKAELWLKMELMERSAADLLVLLSDGLVLEERHVARFARDVAHGLTYLEKLMIAHRDIRSDNLLISNGDGSVKLADFSNAVRLTAGNTIRKDQAGVVYWRAPETRKGPYDAMKVDVWSLGATIWELIEGETPFESDPSGPGDRLPDLTAVHDVSLGLVDFLAQCELPPASRPRAQRLLELPFTQAACARSEILNLLSRARLLEQILSAN